MKKRCRWIDFLKSLAMVAVILDHTSKFHKSGLVQYHTGFAVGLFILVAGINSGMSIEKNCNNRTQYLMKRTKGIIIPYIVATLTYSIYYDGFKFDLIKFIGKLITFSASGPFYFVFFFLQLIFCSVFIFNIFMKHNKGILMDGGILFVIYLLCIYLNRCTDMGPFYGGAKYLLGGSYLFLFCLGMVIYKYMNRLLNKKTSILWLLLTLLCFAIFEIYQLYYKGWSNPPNKYTVFYILIIFSIVFIIKNICTLKNKSLDRLVDIINMIGSNSLYVFLYHSLIIQIFTDYSFNMENTVVYKMLVILCSIVIPVSISEVKKKIIIGLNRQPAQ